MQRQSRLYWLIYGESRFAWGRRVVGQAGWTIIDQGLLGLANFAGNLVLARWLPPVEYGGYVSASALFWILTSAHGGLLTEPMMVFGSGRFRDRLSSYFAVLATLHWYVSAVVAAGLGTIGLALMLAGSMASGFSMIGYALAAPGMLLLWLLRRTVYLWAHPRLAAAASAVYSIGMLAIFYALYRSAALSAFTAPLAAAGASVFAAIAIIAVRGFPLWSAWRGDFIRQVAVDHWRYGRWAVATGIFTWVPGSLYYLIVPLLAGLEANGALNALWVMVMPALQVYQALTFLLIPAFAGLQQDRRGLQLMTITLAALLTTGLLYAVTIALLGEPMMDLIYRGRYTGYADLAGLIGLITLPSAAITALGSALRAQERPDRVLWAYVLSTVVTCTFGVAAVAAWGLYGAILGLLAGYSTTMLVMGWWVIQWVIRPRPQPAAGLSARES